MDLRTGLLEIAAEHRLDSGRLWAVELHDLAARTGMRELVVRALIHRAALGEDGNLDVAASLAEGIDNPALAGLVAASNDRTAITS